jgi:uncharacterized protein YbbC (DUF1343 family)
MSGVSSRRKGGRTPLDFLPSSERHSGQAFLPFAEEECHLLVFDMTIKSFLTCMSAAAILGSGPLDADVVTGAERLSAEEFRSLGELRVGLITNHTATVGDRHLADAIHQAPGPVLTALFGPEHGIRGDAPAGARIDDAVDEQTGAPAYSLYGQIRKPTPQMLEKVDILLFDIQDVGARFYTYISTMGYGMQAAAEKGIPFMVLDRPNPLGGELVEGFVLRDEALKSFVGLYPIPVTHGMTVGELALLIKGERMLEGLEELDLRVIQMEGWERGMLWSDLGREWNPPSPNIPDFETAVIYPGACFFEGTTASEGRGTREPFMVVGAPWVDAQGLADHLNRQELAGVRFEPVSFTPVSIEGMAMSPKFEGREIHGVRHVITEARQIEAVKTGVHLLAAFLAQAPDKDQFFREARINRLAGTADLYRRLLAGDSPDEVAASWSAEVERFRQVRQDYLLY